MLSGEIVTSQAVLDHLDVKMAIEMNFSKFVITSDSQFMLLLWEPNYHGNKDLLL